MKYKIVETVCGEPAIEEFVDHVGTCVAELLEMYDYVEVGVKNACVRITKEENEDGKE